MTNYLLKSLPSQSIKLYDYLKSAKPMSAKEIGEKFCIFPHAVYRAIKPLITLGIVKELDTYPITFEARSSTDALDLYSMMMRQNFQDTFVAQNEMHKNEQLDISFVSNRKHLLEKTNKDSSVAERSINFIVSGLEVPAETMLAFKNAIERGVTIKALVQTLDETSEEMFTNWKKIGVDVRYFPNMEARIFIFDGQIVYFTSYNPSKKEEGIGMRFNYLPYARLMSELFEQRWRIAQEI